MVVGVSVIVVISAVVIVAGAVVKRNYTFDVEMIFHILSFLFK